MRTSPSRLLASALPRRATASTTALSSQSKSLPPVRYHIFKTPVPYSIGLNLQNRIIDRRLASRETEKDKDKGEQDILLLLGQSLPTE